MSPVRAGVGLSIGHSHDDAAAGLEDAVNPGQYYDRLVFGEMLHTWLRIMES